MIAMRDLSVTREVAASCQRVWEVLADGWIYSYWVVGNSRTRAVDSNWPQPGAAIRHSIGVWPFVINDQTVVESCVPLHELVLHAGLGAAGRRADNHAPRRNPRRLPGADDRSADPGTDQPDP
jgi:uncharacterized protein YndB with AHSA1/START domain